MKRKFVLFFILILFINIYGKNTQLKNISLQLQWKHQFQFAGYYIAKEKGFFKDAGVEVNIIEGGNGKVPSTEVAEGKVEIGAGSVGVLYNYLKEKPIKVLGVIFQKSAKVLLTLKKSHINSPKDLIGKKIMILDTLRSTVYNLMFYKEGIPLNKLNIVPTSYTIDSLINGEIDAFNSYIGNQPFILRKRGVEFNIINPEDYGVDFYGDSFFVNNNFYNKNKKLVNKIREAAFKGWKYALENKEETANIIINKYKSKKSFDALMFEADELEKLIIPNVIEIGHMNKHRWEYMADVYLKLGLVDKIIPLDDFLWDGNEDKIFTKKILYIFEVIISIIFIILIITFYMYRRLKISFDYQNRQLIKNENYFRLLFESTNDMILLIDPYDFTFVDVNPEAVNCYGFENKEEVIGKSIFEFSSNVYPYNDIGAKKINECLHSGIKPELSKWHAKRKDGELFWIEFHIVLINLDGKNFNLVLARDISERIQTEQLLIQTEKMMSVGGLAAGMAHEINNPLAGIISSVQNIERRLDMGFEKNIKTAEKLGVKLDQILEYHKERGINSFINGIKISSERASQIIRNMLDFSRKSNQEKIKINIHEIIDNAIEISGKQFDFSKKFDFKQIKIRKNYSADVNEIYCNIQDIEQVFINMLKNAAQAMMKNSGESKSIIISTEKIDSNILIKFRDTGPGMPDSVKKRIFEPFFTTKTPGIGTGLGLSVSYFIITENHGGNIIVNSDKSGTEFEITLPIDKRNNY